MTDAQGIPLAATVTAANVNEVTPVFQVLTSMSPVGGNPLRCQSRWIGNSQLACRLLDLPCSLGKLFDQLAGHAGDVPETPITLDAESHHGEPFAQPGMEQGFVIARVFLDLTELAGLPLILHAMMRAIGIDKRLSGLGVFMYCKNKCSVWTRRLGRVLVSNTDKLKKSIKRVIIHKARG